MPGYWQDPEATSEVLDAQGWLHTGDVARQDEDGFVYIVGRKKDMIISGGFNIYPLEVERVIEGHPGVQEVAVIGVPDAIWGEAVKAVVVPRPGVTIVPEDITALCTRHIASYKNLDPWTLWRNCPKIFRAKFSNVSCATATGKGRNAVCKCGVRL